MTHSKDPLSLDQIKCPNCGKWIPVSETLHLQLVESVRNELRKEELAQQNRFLAKEKELKEMEKALVSTRENVEALIAGKVKQEKSKLEKEAHIKANEEMTLHLSELNKQMEEKDKKLKEAQIAELKLRREKRDLEEKKNAFELEMARKLDQERDQIKEEGAKAALAEHYFKDAEREKKLQDAIKANEELRRKLHQGSQQTQGEVLELELEALLKSHFPQDDIAPVSKGIRGADLLQKIYSPAGQFCGMIVWESKHTRSWSEGWVSKLKDDQREIKADVAVLVTEVLPKEINLFGYKNNIWITRYESVLGLATAIRINLLQVALAKLSSVAKNEKMEILYQYLSGTEFKQKVEAIVEAFLAMQKDLNEEKRAFAKRWAKREKQIERVIANTGGMYGNLQGLMGSSIESIPALEMRDEPKEEPPSMLDSGDSDEDLFDA